MGVLDKLNAMPDNKIRDDDHLERKDISAEEFQKALSELSKKFNKNKKIPKATKEFGQATLDALNEIKKDEDVF